MRFQQSWEKLFWQLAFFNDDDNNDEDNDPIVFFWIADENPQNPVAFWVITLIY